MNPDDWLARLIDKWRQDIPVRRHWINLYQSDHRRLDPMPQYRQAYQRLIGMSRTPWARLVVDLTEERLQVTGIQLPDDDGSDLLWSMFRANHVESSQAQIHREALATGTAYMSVWPAETDSTMPKMAFESSLATTHETTPGDAHTVAAALKVWHDTIAGRIRANVYLPDRIVKYRSASEVRPGGLNEFDWAADPHRQFDEFDTVRHDYGIVPMVPFVTRPDWMGYGRSDLADLEETIYRIEYLTTNTLLAVELGAFRVRWATGLEIPHDENNQPVEPYKVALDRLWVSEDPDTRFGSFDYTDIRPYLSAISDAIGQLSAVSRVPAQYFVQQELSNPPSAASLEASETGLINKVRDRQHRFSESWEQVAALALRIADIDPAPELVTNMTVQWADPRTRTDAQTLDAAVKLASVGVPFRQVMQFIGYTPAEISRMETDRTSDLFNQILAQTTTPAAAAPAPPVENG